MNVLSLFDGMSCGQQALERAGIKVDNYFASEIDKHAIKVTMANYPNTIQLGSVVDVDGYSLPKIDLLIGGSPCQSFSFAGKRKGMSTKDNIEILTLEHYLELKEQQYEFEGQSYLFWEFMRLLKEVKPKYFLLENVEMGEKWEKVLSKAIGVNGIHINSSLVSAQNRSRIYWTNIGMKPTGLFGDMESVIKQPKDKGILLKDILQEEVDEKYFLSEKSIAYINRNQRNLSFQMNEDDKKSGCVVARYQSGIPNNQIVVKKRVKQINQSKESGGKQPYQQNRIYDINGIAPALMQGKSDLLISSGTLRTHKDGEGFREIKSGKAATIPARAREDGSGQNVVRIQKIITHNIPEVVKVRKYEVDILNLQKVLKEHRLMSIKNISISLGIPKTKVEHWFRTDNSFSIPDPEYWIRLKSLLKIETTKFDESIMSFEEREGVYDKSNRVYDTNGISPTLTSVSAGEKILSPNSIRRLTPIECERLQTVKDNYTNHVSDSQRYKMLGNGWTVDVIAYIFSYINY